MEDDVIANHPRRYGNGHCRRHECDAYDPALSVVGCGGEHDGANQKKQDQERLHKCGSPHSYPKCKKLQNPAAIPRANSQEQRQGYGENEQNVLGEFAAKDCGVRIESIGKPSKERRTSPRYTQRQQRDEDGGE